jgi:hypothetical protein
MRVLDQKPNKRRYRHSTQNNDLYRGKEERKKRREVIFT